MTDPLNFSCKTEEFLHIFFQEAEKIESFIQLLYNEKNKKVIAQT